MEENYSLSIELDCQIDLELFPLNPLDRYDHDVCSQVRRDRPLRLLLVPTLNAKYV